MIILRDIDSDSILSLAPAQLTERLERIIRTTTKVEHRLRYAIALAVSHQHGDYHNSEQLTARFGRSRIRLARRIGWLNHHRDHTIRCVKVWMELNSVPSLETATRF